MGLAAGKFNEGAFAAFLRANVEAKRSSKS